MCGSGAVQVDVVETRNRLSQLIKSAQAGEEVVIANRGEPIARLVTAHAIPAAARGRRRRRCPSHPALARKSPAARRPMPPLQRKDIRGSDEDALHLACAQHHRCAAFK
jgi:prevent-host-death family protein